MVIPTQGMMRSQAFAFKILFLHQLMILQVSHCLPPLSITICVVISCFKRGATMMNLESHHVMNRAGKANNYGLIQSLFLLKSAPTDHPHLISVVCTRPVGGV
ncbi:hypothetical protein ABZP36_034318 [Zizania latifolia]